LKDISVEGSWPALVTPFTETDEVNVDVLRLGRVALFWRTPDGARAGVYDPGAAAWVERDSGERRRIGLALEMATRTRPIEVVDLPLGRIAP